MLPSLSDEAEITTDLPEWPIARGTIAALYVQKNGCYFGLPEVDPWDQARDARLYAGPHPVVAHPPCERWGRYWGGSPTTWPRLVKGDDAGCFEAALASVREWGGILEHPEGSHAWRAFHLNTPPRNGGWVVADWQGGWTCCVEQGGYGHKARKATWLYAFGTDLPSLAWGKAPGDFTPLEQGFHSAEERRAWKERRETTPAIRKAIKQGAVGYLSHKARAATPELFRDLLLSIARTAYPLHQSPNNLPHRDDSTLAVGMLGPIHLNEVDHA